MERLVENPAATPPVSARTLALRSVLLLALSGWLAWPLMAQQSSSSDSGGGQTSSSSSSSSPSTSSSPKQTPPPHKSAAQENPFPADLSRQAAQQQSQPAADAPAAPDADQQTPQPSNAAKDNPFPEDVSKSAAEAAAKSGDTGDAGDGSSSSSSSSSSADDADPNADPNADDLPRSTGRRRLRKPSDSDIQSGSLAGEGRAQEDVRIGRYYLGAKDYKGAYARFSDASRLDPASLDAIYGLAAAAAGLHHTDEALANYKLYLEIAPDGDDAKSARKALRELSK